MEVTPVTFDPATYSMTLTFVPDPNDPNEQLLMSCVYAVVKVYPDDPIMCFKFSIAVAQLLGFHLPNGAVANAQSEAQAAETLSSDPKIMAALPVEVQDKVNQTVARSQQAQAQTTKP